MQLIFLNSADTEISKISLNESDFGAEHTLNHGEEIVGFYGHKAHNTGFVNLGFIVWVPPKF